MRSDDGRGALADGLPLLRGIQYLVEEFDSAMVKRPENGWIPIILLESSAESISSVPVESQGPPTVTAQARLLVAAYRGRLSNNGPRGSDNLDSLVPHAYVDDEQVAVAPEPHVELLEIIADQLERSMPNSAGKLRLFRFRCCLTILEIDAGGSGSSKRARLRDALYTAYKEELPAWLRRLPDLVGATAKAAPGQTSFVELLLVPASLAVRWWYELRRYRAMRWLGRTLQAPGRDFLGTALDISKRGRERDNEPLVQQVLLSALLRDLDKAVRRPRPSWFWGKRVRRPWPFVVLLDSLSAAQPSPGLALIDRYRKLNKPRRTGDAEAASPPPLLILGALSGQAPDYAVPISPKNGRGDAFYLANRLSELYSGLLPGPRSGHEGGDTGVYVVRLPTEPGDNSDRDALRVSRRVSPTIPRWPWARPAGVFITAAALLVAATSYTLSSAMEETAAPPPSCVPVSDGQMVGVTDGNECSLAGQGDIELRELELLARKQNQAVIDDGANYRTVVFFAPLTTKPGYKKGVPNGIRSLRGALLAQRKINQKKAQGLPVRLLIANAGEHFTYGSNFHQGDGTARNNGNEGIDVARMIVERAERGEPIVGVIGITQSRDESFRAIEELDEAQIPVVATDTTGTKMVDHNSPARYFQISPTNERISRIMAEFAAHSADLKSYTGAADAPKGAATAIVVHDPADTFFSLDLTERFTRWYEKAGGKVHRVVYSEKGAQDTHAVARDICERVRETDGFVVYAARSGVMLNLFHAIQGTSQCDWKKGTIAILAESPDPEPIDDPKTMADEYSYLTMFYVAFNPLGPKHRKDAFTAFVRDYKEFFPQDNKSEDFTVAAGGFDALNVMSRAINLAYTTNEDDLGANDVYTSLANPGIEHLGATGLLVLNGRRNFPANKAVYIRKINEAGKIILQLACGILHNRDNTTAWGPPGQQRDCPQDE